MKSNRFFKLVLFVALLALPSMVFAGISDRFSDINLTDDNYIEFPEISDPPGDPDKDTGRLFVKDNAGTTDLYFEDDGGTVTNLTTGGTGGNTLDEAYDQGGAGAGGKINASDGVVEIEVPDTSGNGALLLDMNDSSNNPNVLTITNDGSGADITAPGFSLTSGAITAVSAALSGDITLDDGSGASPKITFTDETDETAVMQKADSGYLQLTTLAADGLHIFTGNLKVGNGTPGQTIDGEDAYIEGLLEVDGAVDFGGTLAVAGAVTVDSFTVTNATVLSGTVALSEDVSATFAADEEITIDAATTDNTNTDGVIDLNFDSITNGGDAVNVKATMVAGGSGSEVITGVLVDLDDDSDAAGTLRGTSVVVSDGTGSSSIQAFYTSGADIAFQADNGYLRIGTGSSPDVTPGDDDAFIEGTLEVDGAARLDGAVDLNSTLDVSGTLSGADAAFSSTVTANSLAVTTTATITGGLNVDEDVDIDLDANDEEVSVVSTAADYTTGSGVVTVYDDSTGQSNASYLLRLAREADGDAQDNFILCEDNSDGSAGNGDDMFKVDTGGEVTTAGSINAGGFFNATADTEVTISGGAITVTKSFHNVDTENDDATDNLETINGGTDGDILVLKPNDTGRTVVVKNGVGNIICGADIPMDNVNDTVTLINGGTNWLLLSSSDNGS